MKLPNGDLAVVEDTKLMDYCLSKTHPRGKHKARLFAAALGFTQLHLGDLKSVLLRAARDVDCREKGQNDFGTLYEITFECRGPLKDARLVSVWIVLNSELFPRLVTCYPV